MDGPLKIRINERLTEISSAPDTPLLYVLSDELHLQGPRFGCGLAQCGSCSVLLNGEEIRSCVTPVSAAEGKSATTLEGLPAWYAKQKKLGKVPALHPVQQAFIDEQAVQCGYCFNGMIIQAAELLSKTPQPTEAQIRTAMNGHLCRCGSYPRVIKAIQRAAEKIDPSRDIEPAGERRENDQGSQNRRSISRRFLLRREFLKVGGALVIGFSMRSFLSGESLAAQAAAPIARGAIAGPPDPKHIDTWLAIHSDNTATVYIGYVELGQGSTTSLLQIAAEELDLDMGQGQYPSPGHEYHAESGRYVFQLVHRSRKPGNPHGCRGGSPGVAAARVEKTRRAYRAAHRVAWQSWLSRIRRAARARSATASWSATSRSISPSRERRR